WITPGDKYLIFETNSGHTQYETNGADNVLALPLHVQAPDVDLTVASTSAPTMAKIGSTYHLSWSVTNQGTTMSTAFGWYDQVYLSDDPALDGNDTMLTNTFSSFPIDQPLMPGASYSVEQDLTILANATAGNKYLLFVADRYGYQNEGNQGNNV